MIIELKKIKIRDLYDGFEDKNEEGVVGYGGKLDIRPKYQREFVYNPEQQREVIHSIMKKFPLNTMYYVKNKNKDIEKYELLDGQQRTLSICSFLNNVFFIDNGTLVNFSSLTDEEQEDFLNYELLVYICEGTDREKLDWFKVINIAGEKLTKQELRNAVYTGTWLSDAKAYFSKTNCPAFNIQKDDKGNSYMSGSPIRQELLETVLDWISEGNIEEYMAKNQHEPDSAELRVYFEKVMSWVKNTFPVYRKEQKGLPWGLLYNKYGETRYYKDEIETKIKALMEDEDVTKKAGIYQYVLSGEQKHLSIRAFTDKQKREAFERQKGVCLHCTNTFTLDGMEADHITPWSEGGKTIPENLQMLCKLCNRRKSNK